MILVSEREGWIALVSTNYLEKICAVYGKGDRNILDMDKVKIPNVPPQHFNLFFTVGSFQIPGVFTDLANEALKLRSYEQLSGVAFITPNAWVFFVDGRDKPDKTGILDFCCEVNECVYFGGYYIRPRALTGMVLNASSDNFIEMFLHFGEGTIALDFENVLEAFATYSRLLQILSDQGLEIKEV